MNTQLMKDLFEGFWVELAYGLAPLVLVYLFGLGLMLHDRGVI